MRKFLSYLLSCAFMVLSCAKDPCLSLPADKEYASLHIEPELAYETKAVDGSYFGTGTYNLGLWIGSLSEGLFTPQIKDYDNIKASAFSTAGGSSTDFVINWTYHIGSDSYKSLFVEKSAPVSIYSYHPWVDGVTDISAVPFVSGESDWMWAEPLSLTAGQTNADEIEAHLKYHHAMTCVEVQINCRHEGTVTLTKITLSDSEGRLYTEGILNALTGELTLDDDYKSGTLTLLPNKRLSTVPYTVCFIFPAIDGLALDEGTGNGDLKLSFEFNGNKARQDFYLPARMTGVTEDITSLDTGTKYTYLLTLDNTVTFAPVSKNDNWGSETIKVVL